MNEENKIVARSGSSNVSSSSYSSMKVSHDSVIKVAAQSRSTNKVTASLAQLHIANMNLHGREDDMQL